MTGMEIDSVPLFAEMTPDQQSAIMALAQRREVAAGDVLFYEGDRADEIILLVSGRISTTQGRLAGIVVEPGQMLDIAASLGGLAHSATATVIQACELLIWNTSDLWPLPGFHEAARRALGESLKQTSA